MLSSIVVALKETDRRVWFMSVAETVCWAGLYYLFPALLMHWESTQGWARTDLSLAFTGALIVSAFAAPIMGRLVDRGHGRWMLTLSAMGGGAALAAMSVVSEFSSVFVLWVIMGVAMGGCLYEPCFAFLVHARPYGAKGAITVITLVAGFASTIAFPVANITASALGWRVSVLMFSALIIFVAAPMFWFGARSRRGSMRSGHCAGDGQAKKSKATKSYTDPAFWMLALAFSSTGLTHGMLISHLMPLLSERGVALSVAVATASLIGPMQVVGRVFMMAFDQRYSVVFVAGASYALMTTAGITLAVAGGTAVLLLTFAVFQGAGYGVTSITKPMVTVAVMGRGHFGAVSGALGVPYMLSYALAPSLAAGLWGLGGYDLVVGVAVGLPALGYLAFNRAMAQR